MKVINENIELKNDKSSQQRLLSVDVVKGLAIMGVLFTHATIYGIWQTEENALNVVPLSVLLFFLPIIIVGTWGGGFPLISALISTHNVYNRLEKGLSFRRASTPILINSSLLFLLDPFRVMVLSRTWPNAFSEGINHSIISRLLYDGQLAFPSSEKFMQIGILPAIGLSGFFSVFLLWLLFRNDGRKKTVRNISILAFLGVVLAGISNPLSEICTPFIAQFYHQGGVYIFFAYILRLFFGAQLSFFPLGIYAIFGMIGGYLIVQKHDYKWIKRYGIGFGSLFLVGFMLSLTLKILLSPKDPFDVLFDILDYSIYPRELFFLSLGCMLLLYVLLVKKFEYVSDAKKVILSKKTTFIRRFGVGTLSIYIFEPLIHNVIAAAFQQFFGPPPEFGTPGPFMVNVPAILFYEVVLFVFWGVAVYYWSKTGYKFGFEHLIKTITKPLRKIETKRAILYIPSAEEVQQTIGH